MPLFHSIVREFRACFQPCGKAKALSVVGVCFAHSSLQEKIGNCALESRESWFSRAAAQQSSTVQTVLKGSIRIYEPV
jgi:hypothetical protein